MFAAFMVCHEQGWKYRDDWLRLSKWEQVHWLAFRLVKGELEEEAMEEAKRKGSRKEPDKIPGGRR